MSDIEDSGEGERELIKRGEEEEAEKEVDMTAYDDELERLMREQPRRMKLKMTYFGNESETTTKALIAKIEGKIKRREKNEGILNDVMESFQGEAMLWLNEWMAKNEEGQAEQLLEAMKKRFLQGAVQ